LSFDVPADGSRPRRVGFIALTLLLGLVGLVVRLRGVLQPAEIMFRGFPTEDGYLMLTVARNLALGRGMTSAAGTMPTNGVQPLATLLDACCFWLVGGDRVSGVRLLLVVYTVVAIATAFLIVRLGRLMLGDGQASRRASLLGAAVWFSSPVTLFHTMNMLETGLYVAVVVLVAVVFARGHAGRGSPWPLSRSVVLGGLLGLAFWARNDAVFLMAAIGVAHLLSASAGAPLRRRIAETATMAGIVLALTAPWLLYSLRGFGHVVPVSGRAYLHTGAIAPKLQAAAVALFEQLTLLASFAYHPVQHEGSFAAICALTLAFAAVALVVALVRSGRGREGSVMLLVPCLLAAGLLVFYVLFFDAPHFLRRYLFPLSPFLAILWGYLVIRLGQALVAMRLRLVVPGLMLILVANFALRDGLTLRGPWRRGALFRGVEWVEENLTEETWVGAFQSGTLGFFHDRTVNLDGKINPEALRALEQGRQHEYVVESQIQFVVDWASILGPWSRNDPVVPRNFEWVLLDAEGNFAILGRRSMPRSARNRQSAG